MPSPRPPPSVRASVARLSSSDATVGGKTWRAALVCAHGTHAGTCHGATASEFGADGLVDGGMAHNQSRCSWTRRLSLRQPASAEQRRRGRSPTGCPTDTIQPRPSGRRSHDRAGKPIEPQAAGPTTHPVLCFSKPLNRGDCPPGRPVGRLAAPSSRVTHETQARIRPLPLRWAPRRHGGRSPVAGVITPK